MLMPQRFLAVLFAVALLSGWRTFSTFFAVDDFGFVNSPLPPWPGMTEAAGARYFAHHVAFVTLRAFAGHDHHWYHLATFALHLLNAALLITLLPRLQVRRTPDTAIAAGIFLLHPANYTVLNWLGLGLEDMPVVTASLVASHLFITTLQRPRAWHPLVATLLMLIACGFKNSAVLLPVWFVAIAAPLAAASRTQARPIIGRALAFATPAVIISLWYATAVSIPQYDHPAYRVDLSLMSLSRGLAVLLENLMNPLAIGRSALGYQLPVPEVLDRGMWRLVRLSVVLISVSAWWLWAWRRADKPVLGLGLFAVMTAGVAPYAAMPGHLLEYAYWSLPACAALWGVTLGETVRAARSLIPARPREVARGWTTHAAAAAGVIMLFGYAWISGATLHRSNILVRQALNAQRIDAVAARLAPGSQLLFVPPSQLAYIDSVNGQSIPVMHPAKHLAVTFADENMPMPPAAASDALTMLALDWMNGVSALYAVERVQWAANSTLQPAKGRTIVQPFATGAHPVREIHVRLTAFSHDCELRAEVFLETPTGEWSRMDSGVISCGDGAVARYRPLVLTRPLSAHQEYELRLTANGHASIPEGVATGPGVPGWPALRIRSEDSTGATVSGAPSNRTLTMRLVSERM